MKKQLLTLLLMTTTLCGSTQQSNQTTVDESYRVTMEEFKKTIYQCKEMFVISIAESSFTKEVPMQLACPYSVHYDTRSITNHIKYLWKHMATKVDPVSNRPGKVLFEAYYPCRNSTLDADSAFQVSFNTTYDARAQIRSYTSLPIPELGGIRLKFNSTLCQANSTPLELVDPQTHALTLSVGNSHGKRQSIIISFPIDNPEMFSAHGEIEMLILPPPTFDYVRIPLCEQSKGRAWMIDGDKFQLMEYSPSNVIISIKDETKTNEWEYICERDGKFFKAENSSAMKYDCNSTLALYQNPELFAVLIMTGKLDNDPPIYSPESLGITRQMVEDEINKRPSAQIINECHLTSGALIAEFLRQESDDALKRYKPHYKDKIEIGYNTMLQANGDDLDAEMKYNKNRSSMTADDKLYSEVGFVLCRPIYWLYSKLGVSPDWDIIHSTAIKQLKNSDNHLTHEQVMDKMESIIWQWAIMPLTEAEVDVLFSPLDDGYPAYKDMRAVWYTTNVDADAITFYKQRQETSDQWLVSVKLDVENNACINTLNPKAMTILNNYIERSATNTEK